MIWGYPSSYWCLVGNEGLIQNSCEWWSQQPPFPSIPCLKRTIATKKTYHQPWLTSRLSIITIISYQWCGGFRSHRPTPRPIYPFWTWDFPGPKISTKQLVGTLHESGNPMMSYPFLSIIHHENFNHLFFHHENPIYIRDISIKKREKKHVMSYPLEATGAPWKINSHPSRSPRWSRRLITRRVALSLDMEATGAPGEIDGDLGFGIFSCEIHGEKWTDMVV